MRYHNSYYMPPRQHHHHLQLRSNPPREIEGSLWWLLLLIPFVAICFYIAWWHRGKERAGAFVNLDRCPIQNSRPFAPGEDPISRFGKRFWGPDAAVQREGGDERGSELRREPDSRRTSDVVPDAAAFQREEVELGMLAPGEPPSVYSGDGSWKTASTIAIAPASLKAVSSEETLRSAR